MSIKGGTFKKETFNIDTCNVTFPIPYFNASTTHITYLWGQFLPRPSVALVVIFGLESPILEGKHSSCYLIRHEPMVEEYH